MANATDNNQEQELNNLTLVLETKKSGYYSSLDSSSGTTIYPEYNSGQPTKHIYVDVGTLPDFAPDTTLTVAHGLHITRTVCIYGTADKIVAPTGYLPLPYSSSTGADVVELYLDKDNINIVVGKDMSAYTARIYINYIE